MDADSEIDEAVKRARSLAWSGDDEAAKAAFVEALRLDPTHFEALNDLGALASASGHRSAARTSYRQAVRCHPTNPIGRVNLGNILVEDGELEQARENYEAALDVDPDLPEAHQGLARVFASLGDERAEAHFRTGFAGRAIVTMGHRGIGPAVPALLLASVRLGNMPTRQWLDERLFAITVIHVEYWDDAEPLPAHALIVNIVGDADLCGDALDRAEALVAQSAAPAINPPALVRATSRGENVRRLGAIPGVVAPATVTHARADIVRAEHLRFPLLLRTPGFHTGQNFVLVETRETLVAALDSLPGDELMAIEFLDARGPDGMARKYRVMFIEGKMFPLHLAISHSWMVHYFTSAMAENAAHREEERRFLENMPTALGERAMAALDRIRSEVGLDYFGIDFALAPDGSVLLFEANAAMVVIAPPPEPIWDYRRGPVAAILEAAKRMALTRALAGGGGKLTASRPIAAVAALEARRVPTARRGATLATRTLGEAWLDVAALILTHGVESSFDGLPLLEVDLVTLDIASPDANDALIAAHASPEWLMWMRTNFTDRSRVAELGGARSYASRLYDYAGSGRDQIAGVVETLRRDPRASYATITTFEPLTDVTYIPCVSLLDFWLRSGRLELFVYAHSIDFGKKGFGNLVQLAELQRHVAECLDAPVGPLVMMIKSATIYLTEIGLIGDALAAAGRLARSVQD